MNLDLTYFNAIMGTSDKQMRNWLIGFTIATMILCFVASYFNLRRTQPVVYMDLGMIIMAWYFYFKTK
jgi:tetrahydromethanopterin S-methyltransferase subunit C